MGLCYTYLISLYSLLLKCAALWHPKAKALVRGRSETWTILLKIAKSEHKRYWFHCASLGEYDMALPLMQACLEANPDLEIVVSFYSPSGMMHYHKRGFVPAAVFYLPADTPSKMQRLIKAVEPDRLYLLKYEFWPNLLNEAQKAKVPIYSVATMLRPSQVYFKWYGGFFRVALQRVAYFGVQNEQTKHLLLQIGVKQERIERLGDLRFNRVLAAKADAQANPILEKFVGTSRLLILGSSWPQEEKIFFEFIRRNKEFLVANRLKVLIAPHDISASHILKMLVLFPGANRFSDPNLNLQSTHILILDTIGHLSAAYQYASVAFVGGGFSGSLHNILEPLAYGVPVLFGPKHHKFPEAQQFIDLGFAHEVTNHQQLKVRLEESLSHLETIQKAIAAAVLKLKVKIPDQLVR